jgi:hypothetical protein
MRESEFGEYLLIEWRSYPKVAVGKHGQGVTDHNGWWNVQSEVLLNARRVCLEGAKLVEPKRRRFIKDKGREPEPDGYKRALQMQLSEVADQVCDDIAMRYIRAEQEVRRFMEEFMTWDQ